MVPKRWSVFLRRLRRFFLTSVIGGMAVVLPITIFVALLRFIVNFTAGILSPLVLLFPFSENVSLWLINLLSFGIVVALFFTIGLVVRTQYGNKAINRFEERWLMQLPFYAVLRDTVRQFFGGKKAPFSQVVLCDPYNSGALMTGFVTDDELGHGFLTIFVPTGPNPTNGFIFHVPEDKVYYVDVRPEDAMRTIIGVGTGSRILFAGWNGAPGPKQ
ncbi:MAG: DUF502 domain-containing protein [Phaeodactylibacter sp.]|nr:DUF502 domain-containing protein [Phaeodactylibacter sp.]MCB9049540.1 DUF502 domain-containing protein [Lewinellaceae bacterium]